MQKFSITLLLSLLLSLPAHAQDDAKERFTKHKTEIISTLNKEKSIIDTSIKCFNAAVNRDDALKCRRDKKTAMKQLRDEVETRRTERRMAKKQRLSKRKAELEKKLKELEHQEAKLGD